MEDTEYVAEVDTPASSDVSMSDDGELFRKLQTWYREDVANASRWRKEAKEAERFYAGHQWEEADAQALRALNRPELTFNRVAPLVNAIVGSEINNRREVRYIPREQGDAQANEVLTAAGEWFRDECGAEDEESDAFKSAVVTGMGWTDTRLDFDTDPDGSPLIEKMNSREMVWDCNSTKPNLRDSQRMFRVREMHYSEATELTGEKDYKKLHAGWVKSAGDDPPTHDQEEANLYTGTQNDIANSGYSKRKCIIVEARWFEREVYYRGPDLEKQGEEKEYSRDQFEALSKAIQVETGQELPGVKQTRKVLRRAFIGSEVLGQPDSPMVPPGMFGWECITGYWDETDRLWYGIVRAAIDPSKWSNKFFSQVMYLLNSQAKGGIIAERGAFEDDRQAETSWARSDAITWANSGSLSGEKPRIMPKSPAQFPAGFFTLFQESKEAISQVTGLSQEFIGTREVDQAGVLEHQRRQSSLNLLAELFNSLRRYRKRQGRTMLFLIQEHLADGRLIRIVGEDLKQYVPLMKAEGIAKAKMQALEELKAQIQPMLQQAIQQGVPEQDAIGMAKQYIAAEMEKKFAHVRPVDGRYDIIVDDSPTSPNEKDRTWAILMQMLPMVRDLMTPEIALELLAISPLPASMVEKFKAKAAEAAQQPKPPSPEEMKMQATAEEHKMDMAGKAADLQAKEAGHKLDVQAKGIDLMMKERAAQIDAVVDMQKLDVDLKRLAAKEYSNAIAAQRANSGRTASARGS